MSRLVRADTNATGLVTFGGAPVAMTLSLAGGAPLSAAVAGGVAPGQPAPSSVDNYSARIAKYVPAEIIAFYLAADKLFTAPGGQANVSAEQGALTAYINSHLAGFSVIVFLVALVATPLYIRLQAETDQPWLVNVVMASVAFVVWTYTIQGTMFIQTGTYDSRIATFCVLVFTLLSGFVIPSGKLAAAPPKPEI